MSVKATRVERCRAGKHTPIGARPSPEDEDVRHAVCRYCRRPIMRTHATRTWFLAGVMA